MDKNESNNILSEEEQRRVKKATNLIKKIAYNCSGNDYETIIVALISSLANIFAISDNLDIYKESENMKEFLIFSYNDAKKSKQSIH